MKSSIDLKAKEHPLPDPIPLIPDREDTYTYPLVALPPLMRSAAEAIAEHVQAPEALAGQVVIGAATALAQTRANAPHLHIPEGMPCSLFLLTLANSGDRKSECRRLAFKVIDESEKNNRNKHKELCETILQQTVGMNPRERKEYLSGNPLPPDPRTQFSDFTFEPIVGAMIKGMSSAVLDTDEGGQMLGGSSLKSETRTATLGGLCKAFDAGYFERDRSASNPEGSGFAYHRRMSVILLAQEAAVSDALNDPLLRGQGFLPRFIIAIASSIAGTRLLTPEKIAHKSYTDSRLQAFWQRCIEIQKQPELIDPDTNEVKPPVIPLDPEADQIWLSFYNEMETQQGALGEYFLVQAFAGRAGELARRLSTVFAVFELKKTITADIMHGACEIIRFSCREWARYQIASAPTADFTQAAALFDWLTDPTRISTWLAFDKNSLSSNSPFTRGKAKVRKRLLEILTKHHYLLTLDGKNYRINPKALNEAQTAQSTQSHGNNDLQSADMTHTTAQNHHLTDASSEVYATLCTSNAPKNEENSESCAVHADSAPKDHERNSSDAEYF